MIGKTNTFSISGAPVFNGRYVEIDVIGGTTRPGQMANNTIWVNTSTPISSWYISAEAPEDPSAGTVWIMIDYESDIQLELSNIPYIGVGIGTSYQYINGDWTIIPAEIYANGKYYSSNLVLYNHGTYNNAYEWRIDNNYMVIKYGEYANQRTNEREMTIYNRTDYIEIRYHTHDNYWASDSIYYVVGVDLTEYSTLAVTLEHTATTEARTHFISASTVPETIAGTQTNAEAIISWSARTAKSKQTINLDVSSLTGEFYINIGSYSADDKSNSCVSKIYSIELIREAT